MADTTANLFGDATQALQGASQTADAANQIKQKDRSDSVQAGSQAGSDLDKQHLAKMQSQLDQANNMMTITPQIGMGLVKNTGDKEWMKAIGQKMRADVVIAMYTHGINQKVAGKEYKAISDGKEYTIANDIDDDGNLQPRIVSIGDAPVSKTGADTEKAKADRASKEKIANEKASKSGSEKEDPKNKEFEKTYRGYLKDTEGMNGTLLTQLGKKDPDRAKELQKKMDFIQQNQDRFNQLQGTKGDSGKQNVGGGSAPAGGEDVITIKDSQGQTHQIFKKNLDAAKKRDPGVTVAQ